MYYCVPGTFHGVMLSGEVAEVGDEAVKDRFWQPGWEIYYPQGMRDPDYTILEMRPARARGWLGGKAFDIRLGSRA
jgi:general stress protein 26